MNGNKKLVSFGLALVIITAILTPNVFADSPQNRMQQLQTIATQQNGEIDFNYIPVEGEQLLHFDSAEEFEAFIKQIAQITQSAEEVLGAQVPPQGIQRATKQNVVLQKTTLISMLVGMVLHVPINFTENLSVDYTTSNGKVTSVSNVVSYLTGFTVALSWEQTRWDAYYTDSTNTASRITAYGRYTLGVDLEGVPLGYTWEATMQNVLYA